MRERRDNLDIAQEASVYKQHRTLPELLSDFEHKKVGQLIAHLKNIAIKPFAINHAANELMSILGHPNLTARLLSAIMTTLTAWSKQGQFSEKNLNTEFKTKLFSSFIQTVSDINDQHISQFILGLAHLKFKWQELSRDTQRTIFRAILLNKDALNGQGVANCLYGLAKLQLSWSELSLDAESVDIPHLLLSLIQKNVHRMNAQNITNTFAALAELGAPLDELSSSYDGLMTAVLRHIDALKIRELVNMIWSFARLKMDWKRVPIQVKQTLAMYISESPPVMNGHDIGNCLWSFVQFGLTWKNLNDLQLSIIRIIYHNRSEMNPQGIANCLWALAKLGVTRANLLQIHEKALLDIMADNADGMSAQHICNCLWALVSMGFYWHDLSPRYQDALLSSMTNLVDKMNIVDASNSLWSLAKLQFPLCNSLLVQCLFDKLSAHTLEESCQNQLNIALDYFKPAKLAERISQYNSYLLLGMRRDNSSPQSGVKASPPPGFEI